MRWRCAACSHGTCAPLHAAETIHPQLRNGTGSLYLGAIGCEAEFTDSKTEVDPPCPNGVDLWTNMIKRPGRARTGERSFAAQVIDVRVNQFQHSSRMNR